MTPVLEEDENRESAVELTEDAMDGTVVPDDEGTADQEADEDG